MEAIKERLFELEQELSRVCSQLRFELSRAEEEKARLIREAEEVSQKLTIYTEQEAAQVLRMSQDTLARLRKDKSLPHMREGMLIRYSAQHLHRIVEILERPKLQEAKRKAS